MTDKDTTSTQPVGEQTSNPATKPSTSGDSALPPADFSKGWAALERRESDLRQQQQDLKQSRTDHDLQMQTLRDDPLKYLREAGVDVSQFNTQSSNDGAMATKADLESRMAKMRHDYDDKLATLQQERVRQLKNEYVAKIDTFLDNDSSGDYELIKTAKGSDAVYQVISNHYSSTGKEMALGEAAQMVEEHFSNELRRFQGSSKLTKILNPEPEAPKAPAPEVAEPAANERQTLTNEASAVSRETPRALTAEERIERFAAALANHQRR